MAERDDDPVAPRWVEAITPEEVHRQRAAGWPDFHPEEFCHRCGRRNAGSWWVDGDLWNEAVVGRDRGVVDILCPSCFVAEHERETGQTTSWQMVPSTPWRPADGR